MTQYTNRNSLSSTPSVQGFIIAESNIQNRSDLKLFCAFVKNWSSANMRVKSDDLDCRYVSGRARVAQIVSVCLTYMPLQNQDYLIQELTDWLADRVAQACLPPEPWFPKSFVSLVAKKQAAAPPVQQEERQEDIPQQPLKKEFRTVSSSIDMAFVRPQTVPAVTTEKVEVQREQSQQIAIRTPRTRGGRRYEYSDKSVGFYTKTRNRYAEAQAVLVDAQQQLVHGQGAYLLQAAAPGSLDPSQYELELQKTAHVRDARLQAPLHARLVSAPDIHRRDGRTIEKVHELGQHGIYSVLDEQTLRQKTQRIQQLELDSQVNAAARAYAEGRAIAKSVAAQRSLQRRAGMDGTAHMDDVGGAARPRYLGAKTQQRPEIHDIDQPFPATDHGVDRVADTLLDRDDDFTGLGVGGLNEVMLRAQMLEDERESDDVGYDYSDNDDGEETQEDDAPAPVADDDDNDAKGGKNDSKHAGKSGYRFRKTATQLILNQMNVPQYDTPIKPLEKKPPQEGGRAALLSQDQIAKNKLAEYQRDLLEGGKSALDPRVHQVLRAAAGMFPNDDLFIKSDSDEIQDSEPSDANGELLDADEAPRMSSRSQALGVLAGQLDAICAVGTQVSDQTRLLQQMSGNKAKVIKQEAAAFEAAEAERIKAIKKKQAMQQSGEKPKEPKRKVFKSEVEKQMAKTLSGAPAQVEQLILEEKKQIEATKVLQASAAALRAQIDEIQSKDAAAEEAFQAAAAVEQRKTEAHDALSLAFAQHQRETTTKFTDQIKDVLGNQLFGSKQISDDQKKLLEQIGVEKENFMKGNDHTQMPYVYAKPVLAEALAKIEYRTTEVAGADPHGTALVDRTYLPLQPPNRPPNSTRAELLNTGRTGQLQIVAKLDQAATLDDIQAATNLVDIQTKPIPKFASKREQLLPDPRKDPSKVPQGTARAILITTASGGARALPKEDKTIVDRFDRQQEIINAMLPPVRPEKKTKEVEQKQEEVETGVQEDEVEKQEEQDEQETEYQKPKSKILPDENYLTAIQHLQNGAGYDPNPRVVKKKAKGKGKGKKK